MRYGITCLVLTPPGFHEISRERYETIRNAKQKLIVVLDLEEKLDFLLETYAEYERELLDLTLHHMLFSDLDWQPFRLQTQTLSRRLANVLAAARLYNDQVLHDVSALYGGNSEHIDAIRAKASNEYERSFAYRFMEALRDHIQHRSVPLQSLSYPSSIERDVQPPRLRFGITPGIVVPLLREDPKFKRSVLDELDPKAENIEVTPLVRSYLESLFTVHEAIRELIRRDVEQWQETFIGARSEAARYLAEAKTEFAIVAESDDGTYEEESEYILQEFIDHREWLQRKNAGLTNLSKRYVSGAVETSPA